MVIFMIKNEKLLELRKRALLRKKKMYTGVSNDKDVRIINRNFNDLEKEIYSTVKLK